MSWLQVVLIAVGLSMDAMAVAVGAGASRRASGTRAAFRISFHFGLFQFLMPVVGWMIAYALHQLVAVIDHWIAFGLLWIVGLRMLHEAFRREEAPRGRERDPSRGMSLVALSVATSIDAFAVGVSLAFLDEMILWPSLVIGLITGLLSLAGVYIGSRLGDRFGLRMEIIGGLILLGIGVQIVVSHS